MIAFLRFKLPKFAWRWVNKVPWHSFWDKVRNPLESEEFLWYRWLWSGIDRAYLCAFRKPWNGEKVSSSYNKWGANFLTSDPHIQALENHIVKIIVSNARIDKNIHIRKLTSSYTVLKKWHTLWTCISEACPENHSILNSAFPRPTYVDLHNGL